MPRQILSQDEIRYTLRPLLNLMTNEEGELCLRHTTVCHLRKRQHLYERGDMLRYLYVVHSGLMAEELKEGQLARIITDRGVLSPCAALTETPAHNTVTALQNATVVRMPVGVVLQVLQHNAALACWMTRQMGTTLMRTEQRLYSLTHKHLAGRLAETLLDLYRDFGTDEAGHLAAALTRKQMAALACMDTANAIRTITSMARDGILATDGRYITILDQGRLREISEKG